MPGMVTNETSTAGTAPCTNGAITMAARNPSTTLGRLAMVSTTVLSRGRSAGEMNSLV